MTGNKPLLYGKYLSPYVRRVGVSLHVLGISFERSIISAIDDEGKREAVNPVGRVPALQLETGEILVDSAAILDHYDEMVGPKLALVPAKGDGRRAALQLLAMGGTTRGPVFEPEQDSAMQRVLQDTVAAGRSPPLQALALFLLGARLPAAKSGAAQWVELLSGELFICL